MISLLPNRPKDPQELTKEQLVAIVADIQSILYEENESWNPDKEWDVGAIEDVARALNRRGLRPPQPKETA
jgi:hypothetical protein